MIHLKCNLTKKTLQIFESTPSPPFRQSSAKLGNSTDMSSACRVKLSKNSWFTGADNPENKTAEPGKFRAKVHQTMIKVPLNWLKPQAGSATMASRPRQPRGSRKLAVAAILAVATVVLDASARRAPPFTGHAGRAVNGWVGAPRPPAEPGRGTYMKIKCKIM